MRLFDISMKLNMQKKHILKMTQSELFQIIPQKQ